MPTQDTFSQAGGWLRGNRAGIEMLIDTSKSMLELINNVRPPQPPYTRPCRLQTFSQTDGRLLFVRAQRIAEDRERQRSKFGRVKPLWAIETKEDPNAKLMDQLNQCAAVSLCFGTAEPRAADSMLSALCADSTS